MILAETAALISNPCLMREHRCSSYGVQYTCMYSQRVLYCLNVCIEGFCGGGECHAEHLPINNGYEGKAKCRLLLSSLPVNFLFCIFKFDILFNLCYVLIVHFLLVVVLSFSCASFRFLSNGRCVTWWAVFGPLLAIALIAAAFGIALFVLYRRKSKAKQNSFDTFSG